MNRVSNSKNPTIYINHLTHPFSAISYSIWGEVKDLGAAVAAISVYLRPTSLLVQRSVSLATDPEVPGSIPWCYHVFREVIDLERGPLSPLRITEELLK
jgi:hypothetical protein